MTYQDREEIFAKEALHIKDVEKLYGCANSTAAELIRKWKMKLEYSGKTLRLDIDGRIHMLDYFDVMGVSDIERGNRYFKKKPLNVYDEIAACDVDTRKKIYTYS